MQTVYADRTGGDKMKHRMVMAAPMGRMAIEAENGAIIAVYYTEEELCSSDNKWLQEARKQMQQYFAGERREFDLPLRLNGTAFQQAAWAALRKIPYGETRTYGQQAAMMERPKAARAVGGANHKNPIAIIVPCHRVVAAKDMGGYASGVEKKQFLLALEKQYSADRDEADRIHPDEIGNDVPS